jgi:hypothetical protein
VTTFGRWVVAVVAFALASVFVPFQGAGRSTDELDRSAVAASAAAGQAAPVVAHADSASDPVPMVESAPRPVPTGAAPTLAASPPVSVALPTIGVRSDLERLPLLPDGTIGAPADFDEAGWFAAGPAPGQPGPAVLAGHVDSYTGPAVFFHLRDLQPGDPIEVTRADGLVARFRVTALEEHPKDQFPAAAVYGPVADAELRLITCAGDFDRATGHYRSNLVVFAVAA